MVIEMREVRGKCVEALQLSVTGSLCLLPGEISRKRGKCIEVALDTNCKVERPDSSLDLAGADGEGPMGCFI